jgi:uncharacterized protein (DUF362 family)
MADDQGENPANRREMLLQLLRLGGAGAVAGGAGLWLAGRSRKPEEPAAAIVRHNFSVPADPARPDMAVAQGENHGELVRAAVSALGGIRRFVSPRDVVVLKPNAAWDRTPEQAANTSPEVVAEMVKLCWEAGAAKVIVADVTINEPRRSFARSGIGEAARAQGAQVVLPGERRFRDVELGGEVLASWPVFEPFLAADKMINLPAAKHHSLTGASLGIKNWYGILGGPRHRLHQRIHESLADLADFMRPTLTVLDAWRVLLRNGPGGGNLEDVVLRKTVIASSDPVALDAWAAQAYWNLDAEKLPYLAMAAARGLGSARFEDKRIEWVPSIQLLDSAKPRP